MLLYALIHLGVKETLETIDGIFAFAFYDSEKNRLILARDRMGVKPLYVGNTTEGIVFSSQYDHIINHPFFKNEGFNETVIGTYLYLGYMPENSGVIQGTKLLPHGYFASVEDGQINLFNYYSYPVSPGNSSERPELDSVMKKAVSGQLISDVPAGTFMSGGVDSTLVSYFANQQSHLKSFTIGIKDDKLDESNAANEFAKLFETDHHCKYITSKDLLSLLKENTMAFSEPFADFSSLPLLYLSKYAKENVTVALSGDGGDELFWGYLRNRNALRMIPYYQKNTGNRRLKLLLNKIKNPKGISVSRHWKHPDFADYYYSTFSVTNAGDWLPNIFRSEVAAPFFLEECKNKYEEMQLNDTCALMNLVRKMEMDIHLQRILLKVDRAAMFHSLEVRVPFLSNAMLGYSTEYDYTDCIKNDQGKMNLKKSLAEKSSDELVMQPKKGFMIPINQWLRKEIKNEVVEKIMDMPSHLGKMFYKEGLRKMLREHIEDHKNWGWLIWAVYSFVMWDDVHRKKN